MTAKELFELYGGQFVKVIAVVGDCCWPVGEMVRLVGYRYEHVVMARPNGGGALDTYHGVVALPQLPPEFRVWEANTKCFDWGHHSSSINVCCRCGKVYKSRKEHRASCATLEKEE